MPQNEVGTKMQKFSCHVHAVPRRVFLVLHAFVSLGLVASLVTAGPVVQDDEKDPKPQQAVSKPTEKSVTSRASRFQASQEAPKTERQLAEDRKARDAARKRGEITFDDLKFDIEKDGEFKTEMITPNIKALDKKTLKLRGFILPASVFQQSGIKQFVLVRDNQECCFGPGAALYDCVMISMETGKSATFSTRVVTVKGKLEIDPESFQNEDGGHYAVYKMTAEEVK